ncbi:hypothetical protein Ciccas_006574 [Cichlidogyrus casuarinus]|uniref:Uncharacterized protein n=1 Tax=Cichlidogyrus casuarinus TaxID=1844966 RepID=A0ABD2Q5F3_9PLAT
MGLTVGGLSTGVVVRSVSNIGALNRKSQMPVMSIHSVPDEEVQTLKDKVATLESSLESVLNRLDQLETRILSN